MTQKPKIQYVGQFYVHGSEARALEQEQRRKARTKLPLERIRRIEKIQVEPAAILGIAAAFVLLAVMAVSALGLRDDWARYQAMKTRLDQVNHQHQELNREYRDCFDVEDIRSKAEGMGLVPRDTVKSVRVRLTPPEPKAQRTWLDDLKWFLDGLL